MTKSKTFWAGFVDGKPDSTETMDEYSRRSGDCVRIVDLYPSKKEAKKRYQDVRRVTVTWETEDED